MYTLKRTVARIQLVLLSLACASPLRAAEQDIPQRYAWPWWHETHGHSFWWIFPLFFFLMMIWIFVMMMRRGGMGCMWGPRMMDSPEYRNVMKRYWGEPPESALEILDKRYARGEIDKQEYEEKKAILSRQD